MEKLSKAKKVAREEKQRDQKLEELVISSGVLKDPAQ